MLPPLQERVAVENLTELYLLCFFYHHLQEFDDPNWKTFEKVKDIFVIFII